MKTKTILISISSTILLAGIFLFVCCRNSAKAEKAEINQFLNGFNNRIKEGNTKALLKYFEVKSAPKILKRLVNLLAGKMDINGKSRPLAGISFDVDGSTINILNADIIVANIPAKFGHESLNSKNSLLTLRIRKVAPHKFKIIQVDARQFLTDYAVYTNFVRSKTVDEKDLFSSITLAAFKTAEQLKTRYDSVIWFAHVDKRTFYYVINGKWDMFKDITNKERYKDSIIEPYKMGLVNPDLKEIIPAEYDLIHNISGTVEGLIEVEKGNKKGFYNLDGKIVVPVKYDQIFPLNNEENLALLKDSDDYFYLKKDLTTIDKITDFKISDVFRQIKLHTGSYSSVDKKNVIEFNSRFEYHSLIISPSYLVDLQILPKVIQVQDPLRPFSEEELENSEGSLQMNLQDDGAKTNDNNWFESTFYSLVTSYIGGRGFLYQEKKVLMIDKKQNKIFSYGTGIYGLNDNGNEGDLTGKCNENYLKAINDTLFEFKTTSYLDVNLYNQEYGINIGPYYYYLHIKNGKLVALPNARAFGFTKYVKMDNSYLKGCFEIGDKQIDHMTPEIIQYVKNEIFASYKYKFKDEKWNESFKNAFDRDKGSGNINVDDSLTEIDKYNINFINQKLKEEKTNPNTLAAK